MDAPAWALGFELSFLKEVAAIFKKEFKPHTYGAFGLPKERDIANALKERQLVWVRPDSEITAVAIFRISKSKSLQTDFAQRKITVLKNDLQVKAIAGTTAGVHTLLTKLMAKSGPRPTWIEVHAENSQVQDVILKLGFSAVATKVSASSDIKTLYVKNVNETQRVSGSLFESDIPALKLLGKGADVETVQQCLKEINQFKPPWEQHYSSYNKRKSWTAVALQGFDPDDPQFIIKPEEMSKGWKLSNPKRLLAKCAPTSAATSLPTVWKLANSIPGKLERVRLMRLQANNGELTRHADITDRNAGTANGRIARLHIPLQTGTGCIFSSWDLSGKKIMSHFPAGSLFYLDIRKPHAVKNTSQTTRIHLVIDVACNSETRALINA